MSEEKDELYEELKEAYLNGGDLEVICIHLLDGGVEEDEVEAASNRLGVEIECGRIKRDWD